MRASLPTALRRVGEPRRRRAAAGGLLLASLGLLGGVWLLLPADDPPAATDEAPAPATSSALLSGPSQLVLPLPGDDPVRVETTLRHRRTDVEVLDATIVNNPDLEAELATEGGRTTRLVVTSTAIHHCDRYAGSVVVTSRHPEERRDHLFIDVQFADCEGVSAVPAAPSSVHDTSRTWGDEGRAPWARPRPTGPRPRTEAAEPSEEASTRAPEPDPTAEPTQSSSPSPPPSDEPSQEPEPTAPPPSEEPTADPDESAGDTDEGSGDAAGEETTDETGTS